MKKIIYLLIIFLSLLTSCNMNGCGNKIELENKNVFTFYLDDDPKEILKSLKLKVIKRGKETLVSLNDELVKIEKFTFDEIGEFTAYVTYDNQKLELKYNVISRKWDGKANTTWYDDEENSFDLRNANDLAGLAKLVNEGNSFADKTINLLYDIDLNNLPWIPIGTNGIGIFDTMDKTFSGTFNGNNKKIYNLKMTATHKEEGTHIDQQSSYYHAGLFGYVKNGIIKDLQLQNVEILNGMGNNYQRSLQGTGSLAGRITGNSIISNVHVLGNIKINGEYKVGGLVGSISGESIKITSCSVKGEKDSHVLGTDALYEDTNNFGGLVGYMDTQSATFKDVVTNILVSGFTSGGIIGNITEGTLLMENVCVYGDTMNVEGSFVGGLIGGKFIDMTLKNCYVLGSVKTNNEENLYADIIVSKYGDTGNTIESSNVYYNSENYDSEKVFNLLNAIGKTREEIVAILPESLR